MSLPPLPTIPRLRNGHVQTRDFMLLEMQEYANSYGQQCREAALEEAAEALFTLDIESYGILPIRASMVISDCNMVIRKLK